MVNNYNPGDNVPSNDASDAYYSMPENLFQSISSMVLNIIHTSMTAQKQLAGGSKWNNILPLSNISQTTAKHKGRKNAVNKYKLPIPKDLLQRIDRTSSPAHVGKLRNAVDFIADKGTPVLAADDGIVIFVKDSSNTGGPDPIHWNKKGLIITQGFG